MYKLYTTKQYNKAKSEQRLPLRCKVCHARFYQTKHDIKRKKSKYLYCSFKCMGKDRTTKQQVVCKQCGKKFKKLLNQIKKFPNHFCSQSCAATWNNTHKTKGTRISKLELWLHAQLSKLYPNLTFHFNRKDTINSELDIYIPSLKLAFELNGIYHYEPIHGKDKLNSIQNNDNRKMLACAEQNIELCVIDVNTMKHFKEKKAMEFLTIITNIIKNHPGEQTRTATTWATTMCSAKIELRPASK